MSPPVSAATAQVLKTMQLNLCGAQCYGGSLSIADSVVNDIRSSGAQLSTLKRSLYRTIQPYHEYGFSGYFYETCGYRSHVGGGGGFNNCPSGEYGIGLLTSHTMTSYLAWWDLYDKTADEFRGLVCRQAIYPAYRHAVRDPHPTRPSGLPNLTNAGPLASRCGQ